MKLPIALYRPYPEQTPETGPAARLPTPVPVYMVRYRYAHHAGPTGYDHLADYVGETVRLGRVMHALGETVLRVPAKLVSWYGGNFEYSRHDFVMEAQVALHMRRRRRSIYHFLHGEKSFKRLARSANRNGHRFVATLHHPPEDNEWLFRSTNHLKALHHVVVLARNQVETAERICGKENVSLVPVGIDTDFFHPATARPEAAVKRCIFLGNHKRDFEHLPAVVSGILQACPGATFLLISSDAGCRAAVISDRVTWLKNIPDGEYLRHLQQADLLVLPLKLSTAVQAILESMACGIPVVTNRGGMSDCLNEACAREFAVGDVTGMVEAAADLLKDDRRRCEMGLAARERALEFSWPRIAERMVKVYEKVAQSM